MLRGDGTETRVRKPHRERGIGIGPRGIGRGGVFFSNEGGYCVCPNCGEKVAYQLGELCFEKQCPICEAYMMRQLH